MSDKILDINDVNDSVTSSDLYGQAIRKLFSGSKLKGKKRFLAKVLTQPVNVKPELIGNMVASGGTTGVFESISSALFPPDEKQIFKARIVDEDSPHDFLTDPCEAAETTSSDATGLALSLIHAHTSFISETTSLEKPNIGDLVYVELKRKDDDEFDLSQGVYVGKFQEVQGGLDNTGGGKEASCAPFLEQFAGAGGQELGSYANGEEYPMGEDGGLAEQITARLAKENPDKIPPDGKCGNPGLGYPIEDCKSGKIGGYSVTLHPKFYAIIEKIYNDVTAQNFGEEFYVGSHLRSIKTQVELRLNNCGSTDYTFITTASSSKCSPPTAPPGSSRHNLGLAVDFGGILLQPSLSGAQAEGSVARNSRTYQWMLANVHNNPNYGNILNWNKEPWHWSADGR
jgi:hypothetical protein